MHKPDVFIDANTLISGLFFTGPESRLLKLGVLETINLMTCDFVIEEVREVIRRKFPEAENTFDEIIPSLVVVRAEKNELAEKLIRDKKDIPVLAAVLKYKPDYFVTGDKDFHTHEIKKLVRVVTTSDVLEKFLGD